MHRAGVGRMQVPCPRAALSLSQSSYARVALLGYSAPETSLLAPATRLPAHNHSCARGASIALDRIRWGDKRYGGD